MAAKTMGKQRKIKYGEGDRFAVPLRPTGYALGVIARSSKRGDLFGYFFGPRQEDIPTSEAFENLKYKDAILAGFFSDLGLYYGRWPLISGEQRWDRAKWPLPSFGRVEALQGKVAWLIEYSDKDLSPLRTEVTTPERVRHLFKDQTLGYGAVEQKLTDLLLPGIAQAEFLGS